MSQGIYLSLLSVLISLTCAVYLSYLPKPEKLAQRIALKNFVWFYLLSSLATAVFFFTLTTTTATGAFLGGATNVALVTLSCHALLAAVLCFRGNPRFVLQLKFAWIHSFGIAQNVGFVAMLAGIYSYYIMAIAEAREFDAITDPLTGLYNRRVLTQQQQKTLNVDLPDSSELDTQACALRIRQAVAAATLEVAGPPLTVEISTGTAGPSHNLESLIRQADQGLYVDKGRGVARTL